MHDVVLAIGFEKLQEGHATGGITNMADPLWGRKSRAGALTAPTAQMLIDEFGEEHAKLCAMKMRIIMDEHAALNDRAHRAVRLEREFSGHGGQLAALAGELRMMRVCSQSNGACAVMFCSEEKAKQFDATRRG